MRRLPDGRLQLRSGRGEWFQCRLDMEVRRLRIHPPLRTHHAQLAHTTNRSAQEECLHWHAAPRTVQVPGSMLLRDSKGYVYAIQTETIQQVRRFRPLAHRP